MQVVSKAGVTGTMLRFGYPRSAVAEYRHWVVLLRDQQATLGALVVACREPATAFSSVSLAAFEELGQVVRDVESGLRERFAFDKINYLMLMMVDPHVHFHVLPRYASEREFGGARFLDPGWPRQPDLGHVHEIDDATRGALLAALREAWPRSSAAAAPHPGSH
jgi:diadenosine tetraphosphate (Ap4A) HIT family hydrolase